MKSFPALLILILGSLLFSCHILWSQSPIAISANDFVTTTIFFPSNIQKVVAPGANFQFTYEEGTNIGLLKGRKGKASNLLVITEQGYVYSFALNFAEEVEKFNFILTTEQAITRNKIKEDTTSEDTQVVETSDKENTGTTNTSDNQEATENSGVSVNSTTDSETASKDNESTDKPKQHVKMVSSADTLIQGDRIPTQPTENDTANGQDDLYVIDQAEYFRIFCENNYLQKTAILRAFRQNKKIILRLNNILVDRTEKYFVLQVENNSKKEFTVGGISFFRKSDIGQLEKIMAPLYTFNLQESIDPDSINEVVLVFKNFDISAKEELIVVLANEGYDKMVKLPLRNNIINFPSN